MVCAVQPDFTARTRMAAVAAREPAGLEVVPMAGHVGRGRIIQQHETRPAGVPTFANDHVQADWGAFVALVQLASVPAGGHDRIAADKPAVVIHLQQLTALIDNKHPLFLHRPGQQAVGIEPVRQAHGLRRYRRGWRRHIGWKARGRRDTAPDKQTRHHGSQRRADESANVAWRRSMAVMRQALRGVQEWEAHRPILATSSRLPQRRSRFATASGASSSKREVQNDALPPIPVLLPRDGGGVLIGCSCFAAVHAMLPPSVTAPRG